MSLNKTPNANRLHIAIFGKRNSGKSSLLNAITDQDIAIVSETAGTTADPVFKAIEINPIGACVLIDTAGFDDVGALGRMRVQKTKDVIVRTDIAIVLFCEEDFSLEREWIKELKVKKIPYIPVINKADILKDGKHFADKIKKEFGKEPLIVSAKEKIGIDRIKEELVRLIPEDFEQKSITGHLTNKKDIVLLVMPQDLQAPKGRLILPQVQTIRDLLDNSCITICVTTDNMEDALNALKEPPALIITDSQVFDVVYEKKPKESMLTSFSVLFARYKGDINEFIKGAAALDCLKETDRVLIAEACTHTPKDGDIGRVKIPAMLRKKVGSNLKIDIVGGADFPKDLSKYALIIHCGGCMFNRKYLLSKIQAAKEQNVPITNYGIIIAKLFGILDKVQAT